MIEDLVKLDEEQAIALFLEKDEPTDKKKYQHAHSASEVNKQGPKKYLVPPDVVVAKLEKCPRYQYLVSALFHITVQVVHIFTIS